MSRIGKKIIELPSSVQVQWSDEGQLKIKGPRGELAFPLDRRIKVELGEKQIKIKPDLKGGGDSASWGLYRALIANLIKGVNEGFEKTLIFQGVGFRALVSGDQLELFLGFSHSVKIKAPPGISFKVEKSKIIVSGVNKELVGQVASQIKSLRRPEPYKGRGIRYEDEVIIRKAGKKAVAGA